MLTFIIFVAVAAAVVLYSAMKTGRVKDVNHNNIPDVLEPKAETPTSEDESTTVYGTPLQSVIYSTVPVEEDTAPKEKVVKKVKKPATKKTK
jgi:hypothetical protein